jgi:hypothetical protein
VREGGRGKQGGEMTQAMYADVNKWIIKKRKKERTVRKKKKKKGMWLLTKWLDVPVIEIHHVSSLNSQLLHSSMYLVSNILDSGRKTPVLGLWLQVAYSALPEPCHSLREESLVDEKRCLHRNHILTPARFSSSTWMMELPTQVDEEPLPCPK